jgi:hypothetical protein
MYETQEVIQNINANIVWFMAFGAVGMLCNWWLFVETVQLGFKHKSFSIALFTTFFWTAHDISFISQWATWFIELDYWVWKLFCINIFFSAVGEVVYYYQTIKFGRQELFPKQSLGLVFCLLIAGQLAAFVILWYLKMALGGDPMFLIVMPLTIFACPIFCIPLAMRRQSRKGQSIKLNVIYIIMVCGIWPAWYVAHPIFQSAVFIGVGVATALWCIANIFVLKQFPEYECD